MSEEKAGRVGDMRWNLGLLARKLRTLRLTSGMTQKQASEAAGIPDSLLASYERALIAPNDRALNGLSGVFNVMPEALVFYDLGDRAVAGQALLQFSDTYGLEPVFGRGTAGLRPVSNFMKGFVSEWASMRGADNTIASFERWRDNYSAAYDPADFPRRFEQGGGGRWSLISPWQEAMQAKKLRELRNRCDPPCSLRALGREVGMSPSTLCFLEGRKHAISSDSVKKLAAFFGVAEGALTFTDFGDPVQAAHALFQLAGHFGFVPTTLRGRPFLAAVDPALISFVRDWASMYAYREGASERYDRWQDGVVYPMAG